MTAAPRSHAFLQTHRVHLPRLPAGAPAAGRDELTKCPALPDQLGIRPLAELRADRFDIDVPVTVLPRSVHHELLNSSKAGDVVCDFFGGSGSTLIGCERRERKARLMEIDPKYADCIARRYQEYTGKRATLGGDGRTFGEIAHERQGGK